MHDPFQRIEDKLDRLSDKLDDHMERIAKAETSITWLKWAVGILMSVYGAVALALSEYIKR